MSSSATPRNDNGIPPFASLPLRPSDPPYSAWGLYGGSDELGTLNRLTDARVAAAAASEIRTGARVSLNWPLSAQGSEKAFFSRQPFHQEMIGKEPRCVNDDVWTFNTQVSSQWDGLRHCGYQREMKFYNGVTMEDIHGTDAEGRRISTVNGIQAFAKKGIVGRGVLVDFHGWRLRQSDEKYKDFDAFSASRITLEDIKACLQEQGTELGFGDILLVRSGFQCALRAKSAADLLALQSAHSHAFCGVEQTEAVLQFLWEHVSAVAGDHPAFEAWPPRPVKPDGHFLHEALLAGWGCPIGELFDLEELAGMCRKEKRWTFFVVSEPCNVPGGVASPPNVLAIF